MNAWRSSDDREFWTEIMPIKHALISKGNLQKLEKRIFDTSGRLVDKHDLVEVVSRTYENATAVKRLEYQKNTQRRDYDSSIVWPVVEEMNNKIASFFASAPSVKGASDAFELDIGHVLGDNHLRGVEKFDKKHFGKFRDTADPFEREMFTKFNTKEMSKYIVTTRGF